MLANNGFSCWFFIFFALSQHRKYFQFFILTKMVQRSKVTGRFAIPKLYGQSRPAHNAPIDMTRFHM